MRGSISELKTRGFVTLPYPADLRREVEETAKLWEQFSVLPIEVKQGLPYSNNAYGVGYELKRGEGKKGDVKENFDITTAGEEWMRQNAEKIGNQIALAFIKRAVSLVTLLKPLIVDFSRVVEEELSIPSFREEVEMSADAFFIRFIHYPGGREVEEEMATAHVDQSGFTPHLYESAAGLQCLTYNGQWIDMPVSTSETVIIPAMQMQLRSEGKLRALCHRVVATLETARAGRFSAVCFVQLKQTSKYDKVTHGRLQEKVPGFNYGMSHSEFSKFFR